MTSHRGVEASERRSSGARGVLPLFAGSAAAGAVPSVAPPLSFFFPLPFLAFRFFFADFGLTAATVLVSAVDGTLRAVGLLGEALPLTAGADTVASLTAALASAGPRAFRAFRFFAGFGDFGGFGESGSDGAITPA